MVGWAIICLRYRPIQFLWATHSKSIHAFLFTICLTLHTVGNVQRYADARSRGAPCVTRLTDSVASVVECYRPSNHIITRISIQTAGLAFGGSGLCFYSIRGDDGSCAKHLTVESYTVVTRHAANIHTYYYSYSINLSLLHSRLKTLLFCKSFPPQPSFLLQD